MKRLIGTILILSHIVIYTYVSYTCYSWGCDAFIILLNPFVVFTLIPFVPDSIILIEIITMSILLWAIYKKIYNQTWVILMITILGIGNFILFLVWSYSKIYGYY